MIAIVIVNYRTPALVAECLRSLAAEVAQVPGARAVVVDNDSGDDSATAIPEAIERHGLGTWCEFHALPKNGGFGYGNNEAVRRLHARTGTMPELVWILNPDTVVKPGALRELQDFMRRHPAAGIAGGRIENPDGSARTSAFRTVCALGELETALGLGLASRLLARHVIALPPCDAPRRVDWVSGASMMVRGNLFERLNGFDEGYFLYFEETDLCLRAARAGYECWHVPASRIVHYVGQSTGVTGAAQGGKRRPAYWFQSRRRYYRNNLGMAAFHAANLLWLLAWPIGRGIARLRGRASPAPPRLWWDFLRHSYTSGR